MNLHCSSKESIYSILSQLRKIASYKQVTISFDEDHGVFDHPWRGKQLEEVIQENHLQVQFIATSKRQKEYFDVCNLSAELQHHNFVSQRWHNISGFFLFSKDFHHGFQSKPKVYGFLFLVEVSLLCFLVWILWRFISPNTIITIVPHSELDTIATNITIVTGDYQGEKKQVVLLQTGVVNFQYTLSLTTNNVKYVIQPAQGEIIIYNYLPSELKLLKGTKIIAEDGSIFRTQKEVFLFASDGEHPTNVRARVVAMEYREDGSTVGKEGNKKKGDIFLIKNLPETHKEKKVYAESTKDFLGGSTQTIGSVLEKDIKDLEEKILKQVFLEKTQLLQKRLKENVITDQFVLKFPELISIHSTAFKTNVLVGQTSPFVEGTIDGYLEYAYIPKRDIESVFVEYVRERNSAYSVLKNINYDSLTFESKKQLSGGLLMIATKVSITQQYDFSRDPYTIISEIREKIVGLPKEQALKLLLSYDFIAKSSIAITPWWYRSISSNPERIKFYIDDK